MIEVDSIIEAANVVTMNPQNAVLSDVAVVIQAGCIKDILPQEQARRQYRATQMLHLPEHVLIPGFVNLHTHVAMALMRGIADDLPLMTWLGEHIWPLEAQVLSEQFVYDGSLLACAEMLKGGVTCFNDMYFYPQSTALVAKKIGMRAHIGLVVIDFSTHYAADAEDYLHKGLEVRDVFRDEALLTFSIAPHAPYSVSNPSFEKLMVYAEQLQLGLHTHLHETQDEINQSITQYGVRPLQRLRELGVLGPSLVCAHGVHLSQDEINILREFGCHTAHCPSSNLKLASGIAPVAAMLSQGLNVGLGTDGAASNNRLDMFAEMRLAALLAKAKAEDASAVPAYQALQMATLNGAKALGIDHLVGSIELGKFADLTAVKLSDIENLPCFDPVSHLVYSAGREHVTHVWVQGELKYQRLEDGTDMWAHVSANEMKEVASLWKTKLNQFTLKKM